MKTPKLFEKFSSEARPKTPSKMSCFWQPYSQSDPKGGPPLRGVGGRIVFYSGRSTEKSAKVEGDLVLYLFDAEEEMPERSVPLRTAVFKKDVLPLHYRQDQSGFHGYEFFVPLDEINSEELDVAVIAVFTEHKRNGKVASPLPSDQVVMTLPGTERSEKFRESHWADGTRDSKSKNQTPRTRSARNGSKVRHAYDAEPRDEQDGVVSADYRDEDGRERSAGVVHANYEPETGSFRDDFRGEKVREPVSVETIDLPVHYARAYMEDMKRKQRENASEPERVAPKTFEPNRVQSFNRGQFEQPYEEPYNPSTSWNDTWPRQPKQLSDDYAAQGRMSPSRYTRDENSRFANGNFRIQNDWNTPSPRQTSRQTPRLERPSLQRPQEYEHPRGLAQVSYEDQYGYEAPEPEAPPTHTEEYLRRYQQQQSRSAENGVRVGYVN